MKIKNMLVLAASVLMTVACAGKTEAPSSATSKKPSTQQTSKQSSKSNTPSQAPSSSQGGWQPWQPSSSSKPSSAGNTGWNPSPSTGTNTVTIKVPEYHIFDKVPTLKFTNNNTTDGTKWATTPSKTGTVSPYEVLGKMSLTNCDEAMAFDDLDAYMKVRGNYTTTYDKKAFRIKFNTKRGMLGLNNNNTFKKWVLLADTKDTSLLRNALGFFLGQGLSDDNVFVSDFTPVHVYLDNQYWGMYTLAEQKEAIKNRVGVSVPADGYAGTDIGYFFELDHYYTEEAAKGDSGDPTFTVNYKPASINYYAQGQQFGDKQTGYIEQGYTISSDITNRGTQLPFIKNRVENYYTILYNAAFNNKFQEIASNETVMDSTGTDPETVLAKSIDIDSFVSAYILAELSCDPDVGYSSFYLSLDMSSKGNKLLTCNCPWDFDTTFGIRQGTVENSQGFYAMNSTNMWLSMLAKMPFFQAKVRDRWNAAKQAGLFTAASAMIDAYTSRYASDYNQNFTKWKNHFGYNMTSHEVRRDVQQLRSQKANSDQMKAWYEARVKWLDGAFNGEAQKSATQEFTEFKNGATKTRLEAENATIAGGCGIGNKTGEGISGDKYINNLDGKNGASMTFEYNASKAGKVLLNAGLSARTNARTFADMFTVTVNGVTVSPESITIPAGNGTDYHMWTSVDINFANVNAGKNTIVITSTGSATNFDYLDVYAK